jgi:hypothetical protein
MRKHQVLAIGWIIMALAAVEASGATGFGEVVPTPTFIYATGADGILKWYRHNGSRNGAGLDVPGAWQGAKDVGTGWQNFKQVFPGGGDIIYAIANDGTLKWYEHKGFNSGDGLNVPGAWEGPKDVGTGWQNFMSVFSLIPSTPVPPK